MRRKRKKKPLKTNKVYNAIKQTVYRFEEGGGEPDKIEISQELRDMFDEKLQTIGGLPLEVNEEFSGLEFSVHHTKEVTLDLNNTPRGVRFIDGEEELSSN